MRRRIARHLKLQQRLLADDRLVQQHVVEHRTERVARIGVRGSHLDGLGDRDPQRTGPVVGVLGQLTANGGDVRGRAVDLRAKGLDHEPAVGLRVV